MPTPPNTIVPNPTQSFIMESSMPSGVTWQPPLPPPLLLSTPTLLPPPPPIQYNYTPLTSGVPQFGNNRSRQMSVASHQSYTLQSMSQGNTYVEQIYPPANPTMIPSTPTHFPSFPQMPSIGEQPAIPRAMQPEGMGDLPPTPLCHWPHNATPERQSWPWIRRNPELVNTPRTII
ncbi:hypothetical protein C8R42DRAFT_726162 [Lentinula raphanica]|nr:hypothetical protein C8R42DRAFT_726162 [Lentinula raphanica]